MSKIYDIGIVGSGIAGSFAAFKASTDYKDSSVILFDFGRPPGKRRKRQLEGFLGCFPIGDGKIYTNTYDIDNYIDFNSKKLALDWVMKKLLINGPQKIIEDKLPNKDTKSKIEKLNFKIKKNNYIQWKPEHVHKLSKMMSAAIEDAGNCTLSFENEIFEIIKQDDFFVVMSEKGDFKCKKILISVGRSGWRWSNNLFKKMGISSNDDYAEYGIRFECSAQYLKNMNKSHCSLYRDDLEIGPFCWSGTVIPEDHTDLVISAFRSNEDRWKTDKVSFSMVKKEFIKNKGQYQTERLGKLAYLMFNDRIDREKVKRITAKTSKLSQIPEYDWLKYAVEEVKEFIPNIITRGYFHAPNINTIAGKINLSTSLETEIDNFYVAGESAGFKGILQAALTGTIAIEGALRK